MKYLMLFADNFEDTEAIATLDVLLRGGDEVVSASMMGRLDVKTKCGHTLVVNALIEDVNPSVFDALIIPGGPGSFKILAYMPKVDELIKAFAGEGKLVAAICAAPFLVGRLGYYKEKEFTVFPGFEAQIIGGTYRRDLGVVRVGNFITAKSMYYSIDFGLKIHEYFHGIESANKLRISCQGER